MAELEALLVIPRIRVQNANAISSPMTWGFPSPSAFTGFVHALHRRLHSELDLSFDGVGIVCHQFEPQSSRPPGKHNQIFHLTRNPLTKDAKVAPIVEEARAHLSVSLLVGIFGAGLYRGAAMTAIAERVYECALDMRLAGGSILESPFARTRRNLPELHQWPGTAQECQRLNRLIARRLLPGFALVSREAVLEQHWHNMKEANPSATMLDALLDLSALNIQPSSITLPISTNATPVADASASKKKLAWEVRRHKGWFVPIPAGYNALTDLQQAGSVKNARDQSIPFRFVEGLYTIGEWISPHRVHDLRQILWFHEADANTGLYRWTTPHFAGLADIEGR